MSGVFGDFDNDGYYDMAVGVPYEDIGSITDAGAVNVIYGTPSGLNSREDEIWHQNSRGEAGAVEGASEAGDRFGEVLAVGDFNGDNHDDLAIGVPYEDVGSIQDAGAVNILYGSPFGLKGVWRTDGGRPGYDMINDQIWDQDSSGVLDQAEAGDRFGQSLAVGDFNNDDIDDLAIGVPMEDIGTIQDAGAVNILYGSREGLTSDPNHLLYQDVSRHLPGRSEAGDRFGWSLASGNFDNDEGDDLAVGVPMEDIGSRVDAGAVNVIYGAAGFGLYVRDSQIWHQDSSRIEGGAEAGDRFGLDLAVGDFDDDEYADLAIGVPYEDVGAIQDAGAVNVIYGAASGLTSSGDQIWDQNVGGMQDSSEHRDRFGLSLAADDFDGDGRDDLAVGVPYEDVNWMADAGGVSVIYGAASGLTASDNQFWHQDSYGIYGVAEQGDRFGLGLMTGQFTGGRRSDDYADLAIGVPFEDIGSRADAGAVNVLYGASSGLTNASDDIWHQNSSRIEGGAEQGDRFGYFGGETSISEFQIDVSFIDNSLTASQQQIFLEAAERWSEIILGDIPDFSVSGIGVVDDVVIDVSAPYIDGSGGIYGNILGWSNTSDLRSASSLPATGFIELDSHDVASLETSGELAVTALHEMGHVLGIGTIWDELGLLDADTTNPRFTGSAATAEYNAIFGVSETSVPVEAGGGPGTVFSHWRESVFDNELMTGFADPAERLSRITVGSLQDLGYEVDFDAADLYAPPAPATRRAPSPAGAPRGGGDPARVSADLGRRAKMSVLPPAMPQIRVAVAPLFAALTSGEGPDGSDGEYQIPVSQLDRVFQDVDTLDLPGIRAAADLVASKSGDEIDDSEDESPFHVLQLDRVFQDLDALGLPGFAQV